MPTFQYNYLDHNFLRMRQKAVYLWTRLRWVMTGAPPKSTKHGEFHSRLVHTLRSDSIRKFFDQTPECTSSSATLVYILWCTDNPTVAPVQPTLEHLATTCSTIAARLPLSPSSLQTPHSTTLVKAIKNALALLAMNDTGAYVESIRCDHCKHPFNLVFHAESSSVSFHSGCC
jgi:hypothetical protein